MSFADEVLADHERSDEPTNAASTVTMHPFIRGLVDTLPAPGTPWSDMEREEWLTAAKSIFALIYKPNRIALPGAGETGTAS